MTDLGDRLAVRAASRIVFLSALGKYLPGSVWPYLAQVEMSRRYRIPRSRSAAVSVMGVLIGLVTALLTAAASLPWTSPVATRRYWPVFLAVPLLLVLLHPRVANRLLGQALTLARRPPLDRDLTWKGLMVSTGWGLLVWIAFGLQVWVLGSAVAHPGARGLAISVGGYALAWSAGFLVVIAPAGAGVREAALTAALSPVMPTGAALAVALLSRAVTTAGDVGAALVAGVTTIRDHSDAVADGEEALDPPADGADALASSDSPPGDR
jgi:uncharacterized membrane protein YbhN (UPF0104 family)